MSSQPSASRWITLPLLTLVAGAVAVGCGGPEPAPTPGPTPQPEATASPTPTGPSPTQVELVVDSVGARDQPPQTVVILKSTDSDRYLPIWIGPFEASAIAAEIYDITASRPQTHDLMESLIRDLGGTLHHIVVSDLRDGTFYATMVVRRNGSVLNIDSRPSDAIALAVRSGAPIYAESWILEIAGVGLDEQSGRPTLPELPPSDPRRPFD